MKFRAWHNRTQNSHESERDKYKARGFQFISLSLHGSAAEPRWTATMIKRPNVVEQHDFSLLTASQFQTAFETEASDGFGPVLIGAMGSFSDPRFTAVFEPQSPIPLTRHRLRSGADDDLETFQGRNKKAKEDGLILKCAASYGDDSDEGFAAIWVHNTGNVIWNADGVLEYFDEYQRRFDAQTSGWCRPAFVTLNAQRRYLSMFVENEVGPWVARHGMSGTSYQNEFDKWVPKGFFPVCVQGAGEQQATRYAALFAKRIEPLPNHFTATGPVQNTEIDDVIRQAMVDSPVWNASLAIVRNKELVYVRGYSNGEPDWPLAQPTTRFRIASVSKLFAALAIYQLIEQQKIALGDKLQDILQLETPSADPPTDSRFGDITIQHLLEHTSGLRPTAFGQDISILDAHKAERPSESWHLPVSEQMADRWIASRGLVTDPGTAITYNNCGYYLLGRVVARVRGYDRVIDALRDSLLVPLDMYRTRAAPSLISSMPWNEARYRADDIKLATSVMSDERPLVPWSYGNRNLTRITGAGGLSAAATDLGRIIAVLLSPDDTKALKRSTINQMMDNAVANRQTWRDRAGHGWDGASTRPGGRYSAQKGGSLSTSGNVLQIDGEWGFAMCWGGKASAAAGWYPNFPAVMDIAKNATWSDDLFPLLGMPPLP